MKNFINTITKNLFENFFFVISLIFGRLAIKGKKKKALVYMPWETGNLGDEAMLKAICNELTHNDDISRIVVLFNSFHHHKDNYNIEGIGIVSLSYCHFTDFLIKPYCYSKLFFTSHLLYLIGADCLDGSYGYRASLKPLKIVRQAAYSGMEVIITSMSCNENFHPKCIREFERMPENVAICIRDPYSFEIFSEYVNGSARSTADVAFLTPTEENSLNVLNFLNWSRIQKNNKKVLIGLSINTGVFGPKLNSGFIKSIIDELMSYYEINNNASYVLIGHDFRPARNDQVTLKEIFSNLPKKIKYQSYLVPSCQAQELRGILKELDVTVSSYFHLAIACLAVGTPVGILEYSYKFQGIKSIFNLNQFTLPYKGVLTPGTLSVFIKKIVANKEVIKVNINKNLSNVIRLARKNL